MIYIKGDVNMLKENEIKFNSENFTILEMTEGVYAAIEKGEHTGSNAGIIDLGNHTVIFDTFLNIDASRELMRASEELTGRQASFVINSHSHTDHIIGNCIFQDTSVIVSSNKVREMVEAARKEFEGEKDQYIPRIEEVEKLIKTTKDSVELRDLNNELKFLKNLVKPGVEIRVPDLVVDRKTVLYGSKRSLQLIQFDTAHSSGDIIAYLPDDKVCFMGDLLFTESHPWFGSGNPEKLVSALEEILQFDAKYFVPGHGRLSTKEDIVLEIQYLNEITQLVDRKKSLDEKDYSTDELSPAFKAWESLCFTWNIKYLIERIQKGENR
jgi:glyoxylase-like metal-dependent hydrolase (beta-lactamase superfamily II)